MRNRIAEIDPPQEPPTNMAIRNPIAATGGNPMATGSRRTIPISGPRPGIAPTTRPIMIPANVSPRARGDRKTSSPAERKSRIKAYLPRNEDVPDAEWQHDIQEDFEDEGKTGGDGN